MRLVPLSLGPSLVLVVVAATSAAQSRWIVDASACPGPGTGTKADPFCRIQDALDASTSGDHILVRPGVYAENVHFDGKDVVLRAVEGPSMTRIAGTFALDPLVLFDAGEGPGAVLEGFAVGPVGFSSGSRGILCDGSSPTLRGNLIDRNTPAAFGGGIACLNEAAPEIVGNHLLRNESWPGAGSGGGIYVDQSAPWIHGNVFERNTAFYDGGGRGGGLFVRLGNVVVQDNLFLGNYVCDQLAGEGGAIATFLSTLSLEGNTFVENSVCNSVAGQGGALWLNGGTTTVRNSLFFRNMGGQGSAMFVLGGAAVQVDYSRLEVTPPAVIGTIGVGAGVTSAPPGFDDDGVHLSPDSAMVDAGDPTTAAGGTDGDLEPRLLDGNADGIAGVDIGWDELDLTRLSVSGTPAGGGMLTFTTRAPAGWTYLLGFSLQRGDTSYGALGSALVGLSSLTLFASGTVPGTDDLPIPKSPQLYGLPFFVQALAVAGGSGPGSFSRRLDFVVR